MSNPGRQQEASAMPLNQPGALAKSSISNLPPEIRLKILRSIGDIYTLRSLALSCHTFCDLYRNNEQKVLNAVLSLPISCESLCDVVFTVLIRPRDFGVSGVKRVHLSKFVEDYHKCRTMHGGGPSLINLPVSEGQEIHSKHLRPILRSLMTDFCEWVSKALPKEKAIRFSSLSQSELDRLERAFWRFELFCNIYRSGFDCVRDDHKHILEIMRDFLTPFQPWEVLEIGTIYHYCFIKWLNVIHGLEWHLSPDNPRFDRTSAEYDSSSRSESPIPLGQHDGLQEGFHRHLITTGMELLDQFRDGYLEIRPQLDLLRSIINYDDRGPFSAFQDYWEARSLVHEPPQASGALSQPPGANIEDCLLARNVEPEDEEQSHFMYGLCRRTGYFFWDPQKLEMLNELDFRGEDAVSRIIFPLPSELW